MARAFSFEREILSLTGLRGLLSLWVVLTHLDIFLPSVAALLGPLVTVLRYGDRAVDLFFMLSGLVLGLSYASVERGLTVPYRRFIANRIARLFPLQWLMLAVYLLIYALRELSGNKSYDWGAEGPSAVANLFLVQNWLTPTWSLNVPAWSASIEWFLYLCFPILVLPVARLRRRLWVGLLLVLVLALAVVLPTMQHEAVALEPSLPVYAALATVVRGALPFLAGLLIHRLLLLDAAASAPGYGALALPAAAALLALPYAAVPSAWLLVPGAVLLLALPRAPGPLSRFLASRPLLLLGDLSFALYMLHYAFFSEFPNLTQRALVSLGFEAPLLATLLPLVALVMAVPLVHRYVEVPARRALRTRLAQLFNVKSGSAGLDAAL